MILRDGLIVGAQNHLFIGGCDTVELVRKYGTPLYVMDEVCIRNMCHAFVSAMENYAPGGLICYASKAFSSMAMIRIVQQEGMGLDVVSGGELYTAWKAGYPMQHVTFHGNSKTLHEMKMAVELGVGRVVIDNQSEIATLQQIADQMDKKVRVLIRINPNIEVNTHHYMKTAAVDSKFGLGIDDGEALQAAKIISRCPNLQLCGVHTHLGSQVFSTDPYIRAINRLTDFMALASAVTGNEMTELILGGGFGVQYTIADPPTVNPREVVKTIAAETARQASRKGIRTPKLLLEPGRIMVAEAGITLYSVTGIKTIPGVRTYLNVDGSMADNPRPALYGARYEVMLANRANEAPNNTYAIAGRACESGDMFGYEYQLPHPEIGDILAMFNTGAYHYSMASHYNRVLIPGVVLTRYGKAELIVAQETYENLLQYDRIPEWINTVDA